MTQERLRFFREWVDGKWPDGSPHVPEGVESWTTELVAEVERLRGIVEEWRRAGLLPEGATADSTADHIREIATSHAAEVESLRLEVAADNKMLERHIKCREDAESVSRVCQQQLARAQRVISRLREDPNA